MKSIFFVLVLGFASVSQGAFVCTGQSSLGPVTVTLDDHTATVSGAALESPQTFQVSGVYDEVATGLFTAPGFSMSFKNWYGCLQDAVVTTNLRNGQRIGFIGTVKMDKCTGGTTADDLCFPTKPQLSE